MQKSNHTISDCAQTGTITSIQQTLEQLARLQIEDRQERRDAETRIITALEKVADQGARIVNLELNHTAYKHDVDLLYGLHRDLELEVKQENPKITSLYTFYQLTINKYMLAFFGILVVLILIGTINDIIYHFKLFDSITNIYYKLK